MSQPDLNNNQVSTLIGQMWKQESDAVKEWYKELAAEARRQYNDLYPSTVPKRTRQRKSMGGLSKKRRTFNASDADALTFPGDMRAATTISYSPADMTSMNDLASVEPANDLASVEFINRRIEHGNVLTLDALSPRDTDTDTFWNESWNADMDDEFSIMTRELLSSIEDI